MMMMMREVLACSSPMLRVVGVWVGLLLSGSGYFQHLLEATIFWCDFRGGGGCYFWKVAVVVSLTCMTHVG